MSILLFFACAILLTVLVGAFFAASRGDADGYEDELGFHYGSDGRRRLE